MIVANFLAKGLSGPPAVRPWLHTEAGAPPLARRLSSDGRSRPGPRRGERSGALPFPVCSELHQLRAAGPNQAESRPAAGWSVSRREYFASNATNATLRLPFDCVEDGCGLLVGTTVSYQPLGMLDLYVDGRLVQGGYSNADVGWALARSPLWTVSRYVKAVAPGPAGLAAGRHVLEVVCRGETLPEIAHLPTNYPRHEVHVRSTVVLYEQGKGKFAFARRARARA